jgi:peroxiredoxin
MKLVGENASDFAMKDTAGRIIRLSDFWGSKNVVLVFNRSLY